MTCSVEDCTRPFQARGLCHTHYMAARRAGQKVRTWRPKRRRICTVPLCGRWAYGHGLCHGHWDRQNRGVPLEGRIRAWGRGRVCNISGCERKHYGHGLCAMHLRRWKKWGTTRPELPACEAKAHPQSGRKRAQG